MGRRASHGAAIVFGYRISIAAIAAFALVGIIFGGARNVAPAVVGPLLLCLGMIADIATSVALLYKYVSLQQKPALIVPPLLVPIKPPTLEPPCTNGSPVTIPIAYALVIEA